MINDEGVWLIKRPRGREALELLQRDPAALGGPHGGRLAVVRQRGQAQGLRRSASHFPREWPYYLGLERASISNAPGTTCFLPVVDNTRQYINVLLILLSRAARQGAAVHRRLAAVQALERDGVGRLGGRQDRPRRPDPATSRSAASSAPAAASSSPDVPGAAGLDRRRCAPTTRRTSCCQNLMLTGEALRLGGWVHGAPMIPHVWQRDPAKGVLGLGFREYSAKTFDSRWKRWPPVPASQPNYVGIDGVLEGLCPPYVTDMDAAVDQVLEEKFGPGGTYADAEVFAQSYKDKATAETYMKNAGHPPAEAIEYTKEICRYLVETYGRFPAHTDAVPPARASGCSSRTWRSSTTSSSATRRHVAPPGRGQGDLGPPLWARQPRPGPATRSAG